MNDKPLSHLKINRMAWAMRRHGWQGPPLVQFGHAFIGGHHRLAALSRSGLKWAPTIHLHQIFREAGLDLRTEHQAHGTPRMYEGRWHEMMARLPLAVRSRYGLEGRCRHVR